MFGLFGKKEKGLKVNDRVWITEKAKFNACIALKKENPNVVFVAWFEETKNNLNAFFQQNNMDEKVYLADRLSTTQQNNELIFVEHHPLQAEEKKIADEMAKTELTFYSSLSEPIFQLFGGDKIVDIMVKMGMREDEMIEHNMITSSIKRAQDKMASKSIFNVSGRSQGEWLLNAGLNKQAL